jgi:hypothetical protein
MGTADANAEIDLLTEQLVDRLIVSFPTWPRWRGGWPQQADAALVDAVFSTRASYETTVLPLVHRWIDARDGRPELGTGVSALTNAGRDFVFSVVANQQFVPGRVHKLKVDAVLEVAEQLNAERLDAADQIVAAAYADRDAVRAIVERTKGVGRAQSSYFLMLLGVQGVKADTMVTDWVTRELDTEPLSQDQIEQIVAGAARHHRINQDQIVVDHGIWRAESLRRQTRRRRRLPSRQSHA